MSVLHKEFDQGHYKIIWRVEPDLAGLRLDQFLSKNLPNWSREQIKKKIKSGGIVIKGREQFPHRPNTKVLSNDEVALITKREELSFMEEEFWNGEKISIQDVPKIIFESDDFLVCEKPAFMSTHPTGKHLFNCATVFFDSQRKAKHYSIHRLDRETSGLLILAKNTDSAHILTQNFENDRVEKVYLLISKIEDARAMKPFTCHRRLAPADTQGLQKVLIKSFPKESKDGKSAVTHFTPIVCDQNFGIFLAFPQTGRQHQIRVHAAESGIPLIGDKIYLGGFKLFQRFKDKIESREDCEKILHYRHALHAIALKFPFKNQDCCFISSLPDDLAKWLKQNMDVDLKELELKAKSAINDYFSRENK